MTEHDFTIQRRPIPELPIEKARIGKAGRIQRSYDFRSGNPIRLFYGDPLVLSISFLAPMENVIVICYTNLNQPDRTWLHCPFEESEQGTYKFSMRSEMCGVFGFRIKYSVDGGSTWYWDRAPLVRVHVDPIRMKSLRCYTMIPTVCGRTEQWGEHLDHAKQMGFNMVHLLPVTQMDVSESPYSAADLFALDSSFYQGNKIHSSVDGLAAFEQFVIEAREKNISLCIDLVLNHVGPTGKIAHFAPEWIVPDKTEKDGLQRSGCWHMDQWLKWQDLVKIHFEHPNAEKKEMIWEYMKEYALFWAYYADFTNGMVRLDNLHNSDEDFISYILEALRAAYPNLVIHGEFFSDSNTVLKRATEWDINLFLANSWEYPYAQNLRAYLKHCHEIGNRVPQYMPATTHDTGSPSELFGSAFAIVPRYFLTALLSTGQTGLVQGVEYGVPHKVGFIGRNQGFPFSRNVAIVDQLTRINSILEQNDCLHAVGNIQFIDEDHGAIVGAFRLEKNTAGAGMLLFANLDTTDSHYMSVNLGEITGQLFNYLEDIYNGGAPLRVEGEMVVELSPCGVAAYRLLGGKSD